MDFEFKLSETNLSSNILRLSLSGKVKHKYGEYILVVQCHNKTLVVTFLINGSFYDVNKRKFKVFLDVRNDAPQLL